MTNNDKRFINNCRLRIVSILQQFIKNEQAKGLSPGERFKFILEINIPNNAEIGRFNADLTIQCDEGEKSTPLELLIYRNSFEATLVNYEREADKLRIIYILEEFAQKNHEILLQYELFDAKQLLVSKGEEKIKLNAGERRENTLNIEMPKGIVGEFDLKIILTDDTATNELKEKLDLTGKLTGFTVSDENRRTLSIFGIILTSGIILFFLSRFLYNSYQSHKAKKIRPNIEEKFGRRLIKLDIGHHK